MRVKVKEDTGDFPRVQAEIQAAFVNTALDGNASLADVLAYQTVLNWNLFEIVEEEAEPEPEPKPKRASR